MTDAPDLESAYALGGTDGARKLYAAWAETYDSGFAQDMGYRIPFEIARCAAALGARHNILDLGAGTGLVAQAMHALGLRDIDGTDISPEMLTQAARKSVYRRLFEGDITTRLDVADGTYATCTCGGTFTHGHVGPEAIGEVLRVLQSGGWAVLSVNAEHWEAMNFDAALDSLAPHIAERREEDIAIYDAADGAHAKDRAWILMLRKA